MQCIVVLYARAALSKLCLYMAACIAAHHYASSAFAQPHIMSILYAM